MSKYLETKLLRALREPTKTDDDMVSESIDSLKSKISSVNVEVEPHQFFDKVEHEPNYKGAELAEVAIDVYRSNIKPKEEKDVYEKEDRTMTHAVRHDMRAIARSLTGMRNGGDAGRLRQDAGPNGGDMRVGDGRVIHTEEVSIADMSIEEYQDYINNKNLVVEEVEEVEEKELLLEQPNPVKDLEEKLLEMNEHSWQSIDKVMRGIAKEYDMTPKQLHKDFKAAHGGQIPDDWIKQHEVAEECGWFPLHEAQVTRRGNAYDVTLIWRGQTRRLKFFMPQLDYPSKPEMQRAAELFYPGCRLLTYYPTVDDNNNFMVLVPPIKENFEVVQFEEWVSLSEGTNDILNQIEEEEGEIVSGVEMDDEGHLTFFISDNETGEERQVIVEDDMKGMSQKSGDKRSTESGAGLTSKGVAKYRAKNPGSKLKTAVTTPPSKLKAGSKAAGRRKSFCARSRGWNGERGKAARARWNC